MPNYTITFPDGYVQKFSGVEMNDTDAFARATQERAMTEGRVQTTWFGGAAKQMGTEKAANSALLTAGAPIAVAAGLPTGVVTGAVALAPLAATWLNYATKRFTGEKPDKPSLSEQAVDVGVGAVSAFGPGLVGQTGRVIGQEVSRLPGTSVPQAAARIVARGAPEVSDAANMLTPKAIVSTLKEAVEALKQAGTRVSSGTSADEVNLMRESVKKGMAPITAARIIASGSATKANALMKLYLRPAAGLVK